MKNVIGLFRVRGYWKFLVFVFLCAGASALFQPYQSVYLREIKNATSSQIGIFVSLNSIAGIFFSTIFAKISDNCNGRKLILGIALGCAVAGYIGYGIYSNFYVLLMISVVFIGMSTMITAQMFAFARDVLRKKVQDTEPYITLLRTVVSFAWVFSPILASVLVKFPEYKGIIVGTIAGYTAAFFILQFVFKENNGDCVQPGSAGTAHDHKPYRYIMINFAVFTILESLNVIANTNMPLYITDVLHYDSKYVGYTTAFSALIEIPCMIFMAYLSLKKVKIEYMVFCGIISGLVFFAVCKYTASIEMIVLIFIFKAIFNAIYKGVGITFFQKMIPHKCGVSTTLFTNTTRMGAIVGGVVVGSIGGYQHDFFAVAVMMGIIGFGLYLWGCAMEKTENVPCGGRK